tara:strand:- start:329 stop:1414 length:1086 start_codon:yes stop_codon:yes gene_type:complete
MVGQKIGGITMPDYAKYYYETAFDVETKGGQFDLDSDATIFLDKQTGLTPQETLNLETKFINEMYGTNVAAEWNRGAYQGVLGVADRGWKGRGWDDIELYGLDLRRTFENEDGDKITDVNSNDYYQELTRGEVDWASYAEDDAFKKAFKEYFTDAQKRKDFLKDASSTDLKRWITDTSDDGPSNYEKIKWIRDVNQSAAESEDSGVDTGEQWMTGEWSGKEDRSEVELKPILDEKGNSTGRHDLWIKPRLGKDAKGNVVYGDAEKQETVKERYADGKNRLAVGFTGTRTDEDGNEVTYKIGDDGSIGPNAYDAVNEAPAVVKPSRLSNLKIQNQVSTPHNIPKAWQSHVKQTIKAPTTKAK